MPSKADYIAYLRDLSRTKIEAGEDTAVVTTKFLTELANMLSDQKDSDNPGLVTRHNNLLERFNALEAKINRVLNAQTDTIFALKTKLEKVS